MAEADYCWTCEDAGIVAVGFGLCAPGRPRIEPCPTCTTPAVVTKTVTTCYTDRNEKAV